MKSKPAKILILFCVILAFTGIFLIFNNKPNVTVPSRLSNIPAHAIWAGGSDGGIWYQIIDVLSTNSFKIKLYNDMTGELEVDTIFILNADCPIQELDSSKLLKSIDGYDGEKIILNFPDTGRLCFLMPR